MSVNTDSIRLAIDSCRRSIDDFLGAIDNSANRVRRLFSKSVHSHSVDVGNKVEIEYMLYHQLDKKERDYIVDEVLKITKELGCPFKIVLGEFLGNNVFNHKALLFEDIKYDAKDFEKDYFYIQVSCSFKEDASFLREIRREIMKAALSYIDYLYGDSFSIDDNNYGYTSLTLMVNDIMPLFEDNINNASYLYIHREEIKKMIMRKEFSERTAASFYLIKLNIENGSLAATSDFKEVVKEIKTLFVELFSYCRDTTELHKEWVNDINRTIFRKQFELLGENKC